MNAGSTATNSLTITPPEASPEEVLTVLAAGSKSFSFAGMFLPAESRLDAALLYTFCRYVDDVADEAEDEAVARSGLRAVAAELRGDTAPSPFISAILELFERRGIPVAHALELVKGVESDLGTVRVSDDKELLVYCYRVAGTVGLMMCGVLGVKDPKALPFAVDLGVAMQLTNISRDVAQDADMGRVYIPATRLRALGIEPTPDGLRAEPLGVGRAVHDLLAMADRYYRSAHIGIAYIPWRARLAIRVASSVYRAIGVRLVRLGCDPMSGRTVVPFAEKIWWAAVAIFKSLGRPSTIPRHRAGLHRALQGLPGVDAGAGEA